MRKGIFFKGDVKDVFKEIADARGWTVEQLIKLYRLEEVERAQLAEIIKNTEAKRK